MSWSFYTASGQQKTVNSTGGGASVGTALPGSPTNGQTFILTDSTTAPTYQWLLQYDSGISGSYKWRAIGGSWKLVTDGASVNTSSTSFTDLGGSTFTLPATGQYHIQFGAHHAENGTAGVGSQIELLDNTTPVQIATTPNDVEGDATAGLKNTNDNIYTFSAVKTLKLRYRAHAGGTATFHTRYINVFPVLLGA